MAHGDESTADQGNNDELRSTIRDVLRSELRALKYEKREPSFNHRCYGRCNYCHEEGHFVRDCPTLKKMETEARKKGRVEKSNDGEQQGNRRGPPGTHSPAGQPSPAAAPEVEPEEKMHDE